MIELLSIGILIVAILLIVEVVVMLVKLKVDKMLLLMPVIGVIFALIAFALNEYRDKILSSLSGSAADIVIYVMLAVAIILGLVSIVMWFRGEKEARELALAAKKIDSTVSGIESDIRSSGIEIDHFDDEMSSIKTKVDDYESKEKGL